MRNKNNRYGYCALALALTMPLSALAASEANGLRVVSARSDVQGKVTMVETRISRALSHHVLSPQHLRIALVAADGSVRAAQERLVGPAQMNRGSARDAYLSAQLDTVAAASDHLVVEWVKAAL
jgi:hypothetical protein